MTIFGSQVVVGAALFFFGGDGGAELGKLLLASAFGQGVSANLTAQK